MLWDLLSHAWDIANCTGLPAYLSGSAPPVAPCVETSETWTGPYCTVGLDRINSLLLSPSGAGPIESAR